MHFACPAPLCLSLPLSVGVFLGLLLPTAEARAQQQRMMVIDDGQGPQVMHFSGPEMGRLRVPDFVRRDLPIFVERLQLDSAQSMLVQMMLEAYLEAFKALGVMLPQDMPMPGPAFFGTRRMRQQDGAGVAVGPGGPVGPGDEGIAAFVAEIAGEEGAEDLDFTAGGPVAIAIQARVGEEGHEAGAEDGGPQIALPGMDEGAVVHVEALAGEPGEATTAGVVVAVSGPDGEELPPELRERLQRRAQELAEQLRQQIEEAAAAGVDPAEALPGPQNLEQQRQAIEKFQDAAARFRKAADLLREEFLAQVRGELSSDQALRWPGFERAIRRVKTLPLGRLDGERTDLISVVETLAPATAERAALREELEGYEAALDEALRARNAYLSDSEAALSEAVNNGNFDRAIHIAGEAARLRVAVRSVNEQYAQALSGKLAPDRGAQLHGAALRRSFPRVYRPTAAQKAFTKAAALEGLEPEVRASMQAISAAYESELASANDRLREAIRRTQPAQPRQALERVAAMMSGAASGAAPFQPTPDADPVREAFAKRRELGERYMAQLKSLLPPEPAP